MTIEIRGSVENSADDIAYCCVKPNKQQRREKRHDRLVEIYTKKKEITIDGDSARLKSADRERRKQKETKKCKPTSLNCL